MNRRDRRIFGFLCGLALALVIAAMVEALATEPAATAPAAPAPIRRDPPAADPCPAGWHHIKWITVANDDLPHCAPPLP